MASLTFKMRIATARAMLFILSRPAVMLILLLQLMSSPLSAAELMIDDGVVVKFGADAQMVVRDRLVAGKGIILTSQKDDSTSGQLGLTQQSPQLGDWLGLRLEKSAAGFGALTLDDLTLRYGGAAIAGETSAALTIRGWSPVLQNLLVSDNGIGLRVFDGAAPAINGSSFQHNGTGIEADNQGALTITGSQFVGNTVLAIDNKSPGILIKATGNWWGHSSGPQELTANPGGQGDAVSTGIDFADYKALLPLLNPSIRLAEPAPYFDRHDVLLDLSCVNATEYRIAEDASFSNVIARPLINERAQVLFTTSAGDGNKKVMVEYRDADGTVVTATLPNGVLIDTLPPDIALTSPAAGSHISRPITVEATASDGSGIAKVEFFINDQLLSGISVAPYTANWDNTGSPNGNYTVKAVATDLAGRTSTQTVTIALIHAIIPSDTQGPTLTGASVNGVALADGTTLGHSSTVSVSASDASGVSRIDLLLDGSRVSSLSGNGSYSAALNLDTVANGPHTLALRATDSVGNLSTVSYAITVAHAAPAAPVLSLPVNSASVREAKVAVAGTAQAGSSVQIFVNAQPSGAAVVAGSDGRFSASVVLTVGSNQIQAAATDQYGTGAASNVVLVNLDLSIPASPGSLTAVAGAAGKVQLAWTGSTDPNVIGYDLYRATTGFDDIATAAKVNTGTLTVTRFDDLPPQDGTWFYRGVSVNSAGTSSVPSNLAQATSDSTPPRAVSIVYAPQGSFDPSTGIIGQGQVNVVLTASEELPNVPFLSIVPQGGASLPVSLSQTGATTYGGSFAVTATTPSGLGNALFSARDTAGNRGTDIGSGATLKLDTAGPALSGIALNPASPIDNTTPQTVEATFIFSKPPKETPQVNLLLSGTGRTPIPLAGLTSDDPITWVGSFRLPADAGAGSPEILTFNSQATDILNNVSTKVLASNRFQVYQGSLPPLAVPFAFTAKAQPHGKVKLAWQAVDQANIYQLYRHAPGQTELQALTRTAGTDFVDQTPEDGSYQYAVASVRVANNQEAISGQSPSATVTASATPPGAPQNFAVRLSGQGIVTAWQAPLPGTPVDSYNLYRASGTHIAGIDGLTPLKTGIKLLTAIDAAPNQNQAAYAVTALDAAGNESAVSTSAYLNASLLPVSMLRIGLAGNGLPTLSWSAPNGNVAAYNVYANAGSGLPNTALNQSPITSLNFTDTGYAGGDRLYTVSSVDANGVEMPRSLLLPSLTATIAGGLPVKRGIMNQLQVQVSNHSASALNNLRVVVRLPVDKQATQFKDHSSQPVNLDAGQTRLLTVVVGGYAGLPDSATAQIRIEIAPNEGELVTLAQDQAISITEGSLVVGMSTYEFTRGGAGKLKLTIENTTDTEVELLTATQNGQGDSTELRLKILDADGNVLATQPYRQALGVNVVSLSNGQTIARIPAGASYVSDVFSLNVPAASPTAIRVKLEVDKLRYHSGQADEVAIEGKGSEKTVSLVDTAYFGDVATVTPASSFGDQDIVITGHAVDRASNSPLANASLKLVLNQQGFERVFSVVTDSTGSYTYTFKPTVMDSGLYKVSAVHPDVTDRPEQKSFTINRVMVGPSPFKLDLPKNLAYTLPFTAKAGPGASATNLRMALDAASQLPAGITVKLPAAVSVADKLSAQLPVVFTAANDAQPSGSLMFNVFSDEHPDTPLGQVRVDYTLTEAKPFLVSTPSLVETGLAAGASQIETVTVQNKGLQDAQNLTFTLTNADGGAAPNWAGILSQANGTLVVGGKQAIDLSFNPPEGTADGVYQFKLAVAGDNITQQALNVYVSVTESGQGNVLFKASDIYTATVDQNGQLIQGLAGATINVQNEDVATVSQQLVSDSLGEALFQNLPAGRYQFRATAQNHQEIGGRLIVKPGITFNQPVFLQYNLISVQWSVKEVSIQDRYDITLDATFKTDVPAPVVVIQPTSINLPKMGIGDVFYGELTLTNYGLIRADHVRQQLPAGDAFYRYEFLADIPDSLAAKQHLTIPYRVVALQALDSSASTATASGGGCYNYSNAMNVNYDYTCANNITSTGKASAYWFSGSNSSCPVGSGTSGGGGATGFSFSGGGGGVGSIGNALPGTQRSCKKTPNGQGASCP